MSIPPEPPEQNSMSQTNQDGAEGYQTKVEGGEAFIGHTINVHPRSEPKSHLTRQEYLNREALLTKVKNFWVKDGLEKSLYNQVLISLRLEERPDAVDNPLRHMAMKTKGSPPKPLPKGTKVIDIFKQIGAGGTLLILGEPGAGKTTTLLELTRDLIARAEQDVNHSIPVVFNLSSWVVKRRKIVDWLVEELHTIYKVPKRKINIKKSWIEQQQLLPLLDGLDEVKVEYREQCIDALNAFHQEYGSGLVVCSRIKDYSALSKRLNFGMAVYLERLSLEQVDQYLDSVGTKLNEGLSSEIDTIATNDDGKSDRGTGSTQGFWEFLQVKFLQVTVFKMLGSELSGVLSGGGAYIQHLCLRLILWNSRYIPWRYAHFLDYATDRLFFLQRVGRDYRFMHDLLRRHFAKKYEQSLKQDNSSHS